MPGPQNLDIIKEKPAGAGGTLPVQYGVRRRLLSRMYGQPQVAQQTQVDQTNAATAALKQRQQQTQQLADNGARAVQSLALGQQSVTNMLGMATLLRTLAQQQQQMPQPQNPGGGQQGGGGQPGGHMNGPFNPTSYMQQYRPLQVPYSAMIAVANYGSPLTNGKMYLRPDAAAAFHAMDAAFFHDTGSHIQLVSAYRNFQAGNFTPAINSDHAMGGAIDIAGPSIRTDFQRQEFDWMKAHAAQFGFGVQGWNWGDAGHFSFSAGGFMGSHSASGDRWGIPTGMDGRWIRLANQLYFS